MLVQLRVCGCEEKGTRLPSWFMSSGKTLVYSVWERMLDTCATERKGILAE